MLLAIPGRERRKGIGSMLVAIPALISFKVQSDHEAGRETEAMQATHGSADDAELNVALRK